MIPRVLLFSFLIFSVFLFSGCAATSDVQETGAAEPSAVETPAAEAPAAEPPVIELPASVQQIPEDPCETAKKEAVAEARETLRITTKSCPGKKIEATPVWGLNYQGEVHIRVFDESGNLIEDTYVQPE